MTLATLIPLLGHADGSPDLAEGLAVLGWSPTRSFLSRLRSQGMAGVEFAPLGLSLTFETPDSFSEVTSMPIRGEGRAVLAGIFAYGERVQGMQPYAGPVPGASGPLRDRDEVLAAFGHPAQTEVDEDEDRPTIDWDQWLVDGVQRRATYQPDGSLMMPSYSSPYDR